MHFQKTTSQNDKVKIELRQPEFGLTASAIFITLDPGEARRQAGYLLAAADAAERYVVATRQRERSDIQRQLQALEVQKRALEERLSALGQGEETAPERPATDADGGFLVPAKIARMIVMNDVPDRAGPPTARSAR